MSGIHNFQRRALECLRPKELVPITIKEEQSYFIDDAEIFFLGVSEGVGTCSDLKGINIAVFGEFKPLKTTNPLNTNKLECSWAALLRYPTKDELNQDKDFYPAQNNRLLVERLSLLKQEGFKTYFILSGDKKTYVPM